MENILTSPNQCIPIPSETVCEMLQFSYYVPLMSRNVTHYLELLSEELYNSSYTNCTNFIFSLGCYLTFPPCDPTSGKAFPLCLESCHATDELLVSCLYMLPDDSPLWYIFAGVGIQSCSDTRSYLPEFIHLNHTQCVNGTTFEAEFIIPVTSISSSTTATLATSSRPNQCDPAPSGTVCESVSQFTHYIPLESVNVSLYLKSLEKISGNSSYSNCTNVLLSLGCYLTFPPCDPITGDAFPLCLETCDATDKLFETCLNMLPLESPLWNSVGLLSCPDPSSYFAENIQVNFTRCINGTTFASLPDSGGQIAHSAIIGGVVGVIVAVIVTMLLLLVVGLVLYRRKSGSMGLKLSAHQLTISLRKGGSQTERPYDFAPGSPAKKSEMGVELEMKDFRPHSNDLTLSDSEKQSFEKVFSSILVPFATIKCGKEIGQGAFGKVYKGEIQRTGETNTEEVAIKTIKNLWSRDEVDSFFAESLVMKDFFHPNILGLAGVCFDTPDGVPYILLPFMTNGSLKDYLKKKQTHLTNEDTLPEDLEVSTLVKMCMDIASGMEYLASEKFVHRDLAARNCMLNANLLVKVGDFGLARDVYSNDYYRASMGAKIPVKWMAPETLHDALSNEKTDVWSFGVTCWEVFSMGRSPYPGVQNHEILKYLHNDQRLERPSLCPKMLYDMTMTNCWKLLPEERPTFSQLANQLLKYWEEQFAYVVEDFHSRLVS